MGVELTTVTTTSATFHTPAADGPATVAVLDGLAPATEYEHDGNVFTTLPRPAGELRCRFVTVNDVHFGETEAGRLAGSDLGPILRAEPGARPYPAVMNEAAIKEIQAVDPAGVFVKGDLTDAGLPEQIAAFDRCYGPAFGHRLHVVRGNHDAFGGATDYSDDRWVELPGVAVGLVDTARTGMAGGTLSAEQIDWLDARAAASTTPVVVMGHHPQSSAGSFDPSFLLDTAASQELDQLFERRPSVVAYTSGHTHRALRTVAGGGVPSIEVACVKDFPGVWAEYQVYEGGLLQIVHRISSPEALAWSERCRVLYSDFGLDYTSYALGRLEDRCFPISLRG